MPFALRGKGGPSSTQTAIADHFRLLDAQPVRFVTTARSRANAVNNSYQRGSTIVTTNLPFKDWGKLFQNTAAASAIADRLVHRGLLIRVTGKSRRSEQELDAA